MFKQAELILTGLLESIREEKGMEPKAPLRILAAVSGGIDSMCLADILHRSKQFDFAIGHCNFGLRGEESDKDEVLVREWAAQKGVPFFCTHFETADYAREKHISTEMAARELRYGWMRDLCRTEGFAAVVVAHHANDQAETLLLNLVRGTGIKGMVGMARRACLPVAGGEDIPLLRPLLSTTRDSIRDYARSRKVPYRTDRSNGENSFRRNRIRNQALPVLRSLNPSVVTTLGEDMLRLRQVDAIADDYYQSKRSLIWDGESIDIDALKAQPHWEYLLYRVLTENGIAPPEAQLAEDMLKGKRAISGTMIGSGEKVLYGAFGRLVVSEPREFWESELPPVPVTGPGVYQIGKHRIKVSVIPAAGIGRESLKKAAAEGVLYADAAALPFPFTLRGWRPGDYLSPLGLHGRKKVQDLFQDLKLSLQDKHETPILVQEDCFAQSSKATGFRAHVSAVLPYRIDEKLRVGKDTESVVKIAVL